MNISSAYCENEKYIWCIVEEDTFLYRLDKEAGVMEEVTSLSDDAYMRTAYRGILPYKEYLVLVPLYADRVVLFHRKTLEKEYIAIPKADAYIGSFKALFFSGIVYEDEVFLFGYSFPGILKINLLTKKVTVIDHWLNEVCFTDDEDGCFCIQYARRGDDVFFPFLNANAVLQFNLVTGQTIVHTVGDATQRYIAMQWDGEAFWLLPRDGTCGSIVKWDMEKKEVTYFSDYPEGFEKYKYSLNRIILKDDTLLFFADRANFNVCMDRTTKRMSMIPHLYDTKQCPGAKYPVLWEEGGDIFVLRENEVICWDYSSATKRVFRFTWDKKIGERYKDREILLYFERNAENARMETKHFGLNEYVRYMKLSQQEKGICEDGDG